MPYGLTQQQINHLSGKIAEQLPVTTEQVESAMREITRQEIKRIARNERGKGNE